MWKGSVASAISFLKPQESVTGSSPFPPHDVTALPDTFWTVTFSMDIPAKFAARISSVCGVAKLKLQSSISTLVPPRRNALHAVLSKQFLTVRPQISNPATQSSPVYILQFSTSTLSQPPVWTPSCPARTVMPLNVRF